MYMYVTGSEKRDKAHIFECTLFKDAYVFSLRSLLGSCKSL